MFAAPHERPPASLLAAPAVRTPVDNAVLMVFSHFTTLSPLGKHVKPCGRTSMTMPKIVSGFPKPSFLSEIAVVPKSRRTNSAKHCIPCSTQSSCRQAKKSSTYLHRLMYARHPSFANAQCVPQERKVQQFSRNVADHFSDPIPGHNAADSAEWHCPLLSLHPLSTDKETDERSPSGTSHAT